ncbi:MAG: flavin reductase family protein [Planctomycetaceae bacterium]
MAQSSPETLNDKLAPLLGRVPSGVFILVAGNDQGQRTGMLASWVQQASFEPPQVTVAVNKVRYLNEWLKPDSPVTLNQVRRNDPSLFRHFGKGFEPDEDAFDGVDSEESECGLPQLPDAMITFEGSITSKMEAGDHIIYLVTLTSGTAHQDPVDFDPFVHIRKNGFSY